MNKNFNVCIVGKPNVGKSTIFNKILDKNISEVSQVAGTTIYPIVSFKEFKNININLIDLLCLKIIYLIFLTTIFLSLIKKMEKFYLIKKFYQKIKKK